MFGSWLVPRRPALVAAAFGAALLAAVLALAPRGQALAQSAPPAGLVQAAQAFVAPLAGVQPSGVTVLRAEPVTWSDGCLGVAQPGTACTQALVDGWVVWASAGGTAYRLHTDLAAETNAPNAVIKVGSSTVAAAAVSSAPLPAGAAPRTVGAGGFHGKVPAAGQIALLVTEGVTDASRLAQALVTSGCTPVSLAVIVSGEWRVYVVGAPAAVNAAFPATLADTTAFAVRCA